MFLLKIASRTLSTGGRMRCPSIRFRHGPARQQQAAGGATKQAGAPSNAAQGQKAQPAEAIYDFELPQRFRRLPLSEEEIGYINRGGPE